MSNSFEQYLRATIELPAEEWAFMTPQLRYQPLRKKEVWVAAGQICAQWAFVETGVIRSFLLIGEREVTDAFFPAGTMAASFTSFLDQSPSDWALQALTPCQLVTISYELLQVLYARHSCWLQWGLKVMQTQFLHKCRRETGFLYLSAAERYADLRRHFPTLEQQVAQYYLASYLGISPETLSRLRIQKG